jgi:propionyl-CoA synthetase
LKNYGVEKGDRVVIYLPMIPEALISMLACARLGAVHSVVFGGFAPPELAVRLDDATPKVLLTASCGIEINRVIEYKPIVDKAIEMAQHKPDTCVVLQRPQASANLQPGRDVDWQQAVADAKPADCVPVKGSDPLYILYTSGTTGKPKGVVRENGGHAVAMKYSMSAIYDIEPGEVYWAASDVGWVVGHSYIVYGPLIHGCTTVLYEGKPIMTPDAGAFWRVISEHGVKALFTAPTAFRAIKKEDPDGALAAKYDLSCLKTIFAAGERLDPPTYEWLAETYKVPVLDHWWQTETGWAIAANMHGLEPMPVKSGSSTVPVPGFNVQILDEAGNRLGPDQQGFIAIKLPLPPSCLTTIWGDVERFKENYLETYPGVHRRNGRSGRQASDGRRVRGDRSARRTQGSDADGIRGAEECRGRPTRSDRRGTGTAGAPGYRRGGRVQGSAGRRSSAENPLRKDIAQNAALDGRRRRLRGAVDDRRSGRARRNQGPALNNRFWH